MKKISLAMFIAASLGGSVLAENLTIPEKFWKSPATQDRFTTLAAGWNGDSLNADFALSSPLAGGFGVKSGIPGADGKGVEIEKIGGYLHFHGDSNLNPELATIRFMVKGKVWEKGQEMTLFSVRRETFSVEVVRRSDRLSLVLRKFVHMPPSKAPKTGVDWRMISEVSTPLSGDLSPDLWHSVVASWDQKTGTGSILLDGKGESGKLQFPADKRGAMVIMLASAANTKFNKDGLSIPGTMFDEVQFYNQRLEDMIKWADAPAADKLLVKAEEGARKYYQTLAKLQRTGGWQNVYSWPTMIGSDAQGRMLIQYDDVISNDKSRGSALLACWLLYGYELFNDHYYLDMARKCADFFVAAQTPEGGWNYLYKVTVNNVTYAELPEFKFQDSAQCHPLYLMGYIYRLTGDKKYYDAMMKSGEFHLTAQNPDGSWSHHYSIERKRGETARSLPQGGEINDLAMNDAIDVMVLMYHFTKDRRYIDALKRAGDWMLKSQLKGAVNGWAQQYNNQTIPAWARNFEPPALSHSATDDACKALAELYCLSGDKRYLDAIVESSEWFAKAFPDQKMYAYYDHTNGRPIVARLDKIYYLDDPKDREEYGSFFRGHVPGKDKRSPNFKSILASAVYPVKEKPLSREDLPEMLKLTRSLGKMAADTQNEAGVWVYPQYGDGVESIGAGFILGQGRMFMLLRYLDVLKTMRGELPLEFRGGIYPHGPGNLKNLVKPDSWYDIPWNETGK